MKSSCGVPEARYRYMHSDARAVSKVGTNCSGGSCGEIGCQCTLLLLHILPLPVNNGMGASEQDQAWGMQVQK